MLACFDNTDITCINIGEYTSPSVVGVYTEFGDLFSFSDSKRANIPGVLSHEINSYVSGVPFPIDRSEISVPRCVTDIRITDAMLPDRQMLIRYCESMRPFTLKLSSAPYVVKAFIRDYRIGRRACDVIILTVPSGIGFHKNGTTFTERRLLILADGDAKLSADACSIDVLAGMSRIAFISGQPDECIKNAQYFFDDSPYLDMSDLNAPFKSGFDDLFISYIADDSASEKTLTFDAAVTLASLQTGAGGIISSAFDPFVNMNELRDNVRAFLNLGAYTRARRAIDFFCNAYEINKTFSQVISSDLKQEQKYFSASSPGCAKLISAILDYAETTGDTKFAIQRVRIMREAMYALTKEISLSSLPFSGNEREFYDIMFDIRSPYQGSLDSTLEYASAIMRFDRFCKEHNIVLPHDNGSALRRANELFDSVENNFISQDMVFLCFPERLGAVKPPRFAYGDCEICRMGLSGSYYGVLEKDVNGHYLCPLCLRHSEKNASPQPDQRMQGPHAAAILLSEPLMRRRLGRERCDLILKRALSDVFERYLTINAITAARLLALVKLLDRDNKDAQSALLAMLKENTDGLFSLRRSCSLASHTILALF